MQPSPARSCRPPKATVTASPAPTSAADTTTVRPSIAPLDSRKTAARAAAPAAATAAPAAPAAPARCLARDGPHVRRDPRRGDRAARAAARAPALERAHAALRGAAAQPHRPHRRAARAAQGSPRARPRFHARPPRDLAAHGVARAAPRIVEGRGAHVLREPLGHGARRGSLLQVRRPVREEGRAATRASSGSRSRKAPAAPRPPPRHGPSRLSTLWAARSCSTISRCTPTCCRCSRSRASVW